MAQLLFLCDTYAPNIGGSETVLLECARGASAAGHGVVVLVPQSACGRAEQQEFDHGEPYLIKRSRVWAVLFRVGSCRHKLLNRVARAFIPPTIFIMAMTRGGLRADAVVAGHAVPAGNVALWLGRLCRRPVMVITYGEEVTVYARGTRLRGWLRRVLRGADVITCLTADSAAEIIEVEPALKHPPMICPPPADEMILVTSPVEGEKVRRQHGLERKRVMLTVARLVPRKGIDVTLRAFAETAADYPDLIYTVVGDGPHRADLETLARELRVADRVLFLGHVENLAAWYHACDMFVMPNRQMPDGEREGYGIVFAEAGFAGKPVIGGRSGGAIDAIEHGVTGLLVDPSDHLAVADAIRQLLDDPPRATAMGLAGRERALRLSSSKAYRVRFNEVLRGAGFLPDVS